MNLIRRIPANVVNGIVVAAGIASIQIAFGALGGAHAAQLAVSGAVCTSLADVPSTVSRTRHRVPAAAVLSLLAALTVDVLRTHPALLGSAIALIGFIAMMTMAWGLRAGAVSFAPILSLVFAMAMPPSAEPLVVRAGWNAAGAAAYLLWALAAGWWLQRRYRALALSAAIGSAAALLRARADLLLQDCGKTTGAADAAETSATALQAWVRREAELADRLQTARDFIFAQNDSDTARRDTAILLRLIDLRDVLLASSTWRCWSPTHPGAPFCGNWATACAPWRVRSTSRWWHGATGSHRSPGSGLHPMALTDWCSCPPMTPGRACCLHWRCACAASATTRLRSTACCAEGMKQRRSPGPSCGASSRPRAGPGRPCEPNGTGSRQCCATRCAPAWHCPAPISSRWPCPGPHIRTGWC
jgi:hypothetical protein